MKKILFVCTANIFRSRFAEEVFNSLAIDSGLSMSAFSAGLRVGEFTTRKLSDKIFAEYAPTKHNFEDWGRPDRRHLKKNFRQITGAILPQIMANVQQTIAGSHEGTKNNLEMGRNVNGKPKKNVMKTFSIPHTPSLSFHFSR